MSGRRAILLVVLASSVAAFAALVDAPLAIRLPLGLLAVLVLPGCALILALFRSDDLESLERWALAVPFSFMLLIVVAPFLDGMPSGLDPRAVVMALYVVTLAISAVAYWRLRVGPGRRQASPDRSDAGVPAGARSSRGIRATIGSSIAWDRTAPRIRRMAPSILVATTLLVGSLALAALSDRGARTTEFFVLGSSGIAEGYPSVVKVGQPIEVAVAIRNHEERATRYRIVVRSPSSDLAEIGPFELGAHEAWAGDVRFALPDPGTDQEIRISLIKDDEIEPYRSLRLWTDVGGGA